MHDTMYDTPIVGSLRYNTNLFFLI
jgi:hypothetical protein